MKPRHEVIWFSHRKNRKRTTFDIAWGHSPELGGWDLMMWQRVCQEFCVFDRLAHLFSYYRDSLPGDFDMGVTTPAAESGECLHCPGELVERVRDIVIESKICFERNYFVGAHNE